jgi:hypothetical protein
VVAGAALARRALVAVGVVVAVLQGALWLPAHWARTDTANLDFTVYREAAASVVAGRPVYGSCRGSDVRVPPNCYLYPPPFAAALAPLGGLSARAFQRAWYLAILVGFWGYAAALTAIACRRVTLARLSIAGLVLLFTPGTAVTMSFGNGDLFVWTLSALALASPRWRAALAGAALLKLYPAWAAGVAVVREGRRALWPSAVVGAAGFLLGGLVLGFGAYAAWLRDSGPVLAQGSLVWINFSVPMAALRLLSALGLGDLSGPALPAGAVTFLVLAEIGGVGLVAIATRRTRPEMQYALVLLAAVVFAPICWWYYAPVALIPGAVWVRGQRETLSAADAQDGQQRSAGQ